MYHKKPTIKIYCKKIAQKTETHLDLLEHHKRLYKFFDQFNVKYRLNCDFTKELNVLNRIIALGTNLYVG